MDNFWWSVCLATLKVSLILDVLYFGNLQGVAYCLACRDHVRILFCLALADVRTRRLAIFADVDERQFVCDLPSMRPPQRRIAILVFQTTLFLVTKTR